MTADEPTIKKNIFLSGNFAPIDQEQEYLCDEIIGEIPKDLQGCYLRIGSNPQFVWDERLYYWFDGDGMIHKMTFDQGKARYQNRWVRTKGFEIESEKGYSIWKGTRAIPDFNNEYGLPMKNVANTALIWQANRLLAMWEGGSPHEIDINDLSTNGMADFKGGWKDLFSAHPKLDPRTGEMIAFHYNPYMKPYFVYGVVNPEGEVVHKTEVDLPKAAMIHDIAFTEQYSLVLDLPVTFDMERMNHGKPPLDWDPENGARIGVLGRYDGGEKIRWFEVKTCGLYHIANAFEEGDEVVLEACRNKVLDILGEHKVPAEEQYGHYYQWRFNLKTGTVIEKQLDDSATEFPIINTQFNGVKNRYSYMLKLQENKRLLPFFEGLNYFDRETGETKTHYFGESRFGGEFSFAPKLNAKEENDGYLIGFVWDEVKQRSECLVLDAKNLDKEPLARIIMNSRVPFGFHALWVPEDEIKQQVSRL